MWASPPEVLESRFSKLLAVGSISQINFVTAQQSTSQWGASYRLIAAEKWKAQSAAMGRAATDALVEYARPKPGMNVLDLAAGTGEPGISIAHRIGPEGHVTALDMSQ